MIKITKCVTFTDKEHRSSQGNVPQTKEINIKIETKDIVSIMTLVLTIIKFIISF